MRGIDPSLMGVSPSHLYGNTRIPAGKIGNDVEDSIHKTKRSGLVKHHDAENTQAQQSIVVIFMYLTFGMQFSREDVIFQASAALTARKLPNCARKTRERPECDHILRKRSHRKTHLAYSLWALDDPPSDIVAIDLGHTVSWIHSSSLYTLIYVIV